MKLHYLFNPYYRKMLQVFKYSGLNRKYQLGNKTIDIFPDITTIKQSFNETIINFSLPYGMSPDTVKQNLFAFKQMFGENTQITGDLRLFSVHVYHKSMPNKLIYSYSSIEQSLTGLSLPIILGINSLGEFTSYDMEKYPHLLVGGATGFGKSSYLRSVLCSLMLYQSPDDLRFVMGDLKFSELTLFRGYAHVESVSTSFTELLIELTKVKKEMERRGRMLEKAKCTHINQIGGIPNIIVCIDEVALLKDEKQIMDILEDISTIGRALGVYLILAMQRPDADVLDGKLKNNLTVRVSFHQSNRLNSKIILDEFGAEKLKSRGRALVHIIDTQLMQTPLLTTSKLEKYLESYYVDHPSSLNDELVTQEKLSFNLLDGDD